MSNAYILKPVAYTLLIVAIVTGALAMWSETLKINVGVNTGELHWRFKPGSEIVKDECGTGSLDWNATYLTNGSVGAERIDDAKDVGCTSAHFYDTDGDGDLDTLNITIHNGYPWYYTHVAFAVENDGTIPLKIWKVVIHGRTTYEITSSTGMRLDLTGDGKPDVLIWWGDNFGKQLHPGDYADISLEIVVLQDAPENANLTVSITMYAIQWNEYDSVMSPTTTITGGA